MTYAIKKDVPIPDAPTGGRPCKYPMGQMTSGDSFCVPLTDAKPKQVRQAVSAYARRNGGSFVVRDMPAGTAVWKK